MNKTIRLNLLFFIFVLPTMLVKAQFSTYIYTETGENNDSEGLYLKAAAIGRYDFKFFNIESGIQTDLISSNSDVISGFFFKIGPKLNFERFNCGIQPFFLRTTYSNIVEENDFGILAKIRFVHFSFDLGTNFRRLGYTDNAITKFEFDPKYSHIDDIWNVMYSLSYDLNPKLKIYNVGMTITNFDVFLINQMTLPMFNIHGSLKISKKINLFAEAWYKTAGGLNLHTNFFGFFAKTGFKFNLK